MTARKDRSAERTNGPERRAHPRYAVNCPVTILPISGAVKMSGTMSDLSIGGCRILTEQLFQPGILVRVEVQFQLCGIAFRIVGVTTGSRQTKSFAVRFLDMPQRRRKELGEVLAEVASANAAIDAAASLIFASSAQPPTPASKPTLTTVASVRVSTREASQSPAQPAKPADAGRSLRAAPERSRERRSQSRHAVDTSARLLLIKTGIGMKGRILNLSLGGCRIRTDERFDVGIYVRVEAEFYLHGLPFRVGGVSQAIMDQNTIGVRFLDMSDRRRQQLTELIEEIAEAAASGHVSANMDHSASGGNIPASG